MVIFDPLDFKCALSRTIRSIMQNITVGGTALIKFGAGAGLFFVWTVLEKQVIEPFGIYQFMPFYRVDGICAWDILAITVIFAAFVRSKRRSGKENP